MRKFKVVGTHIEVDTLSEAKAFAKVNKKKEIINTKNDAIYILNKQGKWESNIPSRKEIREDNEEYERSIEENWVIWEKCKQKKAINPKIKCKTIDDLFE